VVRVKPSSSARTEVLKRKRALIRRLIEQNGWASRPDHGASKSPGDAESKVITFPVASRAT
jgi:hypothetical protein